MARVVRVSVRDRMACLVGHYPYDELISEWSYSVPNYQFIKHRFPNWDGRIKLLKNDRVPIGLFRATRKEIEAKAGIRFKVKIRRDDFARKSRPPIVSDKDHDHQNRALEACLDAVDRYGGGLVLSATGSGKTRLAAMFFATMRGSGLFVVDQLNLLIQAKKDIEKVLGEKVGIVGKSLFKPRRITVATIQTLALHRYDRRFLPWFESIDVQFIDEIHAQMNRSNFDVVTSVCPKAVFGLTATLQLKQKPVRLRAYALAGPVIFEYPLQQGMKDKVLSKGVACLVNIENKDTGSSRKSHEVYNHAIVDNHERNDLIRSLAKALVRNRRFVIILVQRIRHLKILANKLKSLNPKIVWGGVDLSDRERYQSRMERGKCHLIIANQVFNKGVDIHRVDAIIDAAAGSSQNNCIQKFGRGVRKHKHKTGLLYFSIQDIDPDAFRIKEENKRRRQQNIVRKRQGRLPIRLLQVNRFHKASDERRKALKKAGITITEIDWDDNPKQVIRQASQALQKIDYRG